MDTNNKFSLMCSNNEIGTLLDIMKDKESMLSQNLDLTKLYLSYLLLKPDMAIHFAIYYEEPEDPLISENVNLWENL